jgi:gas vesicle protein
MPPSCQPDTVLCAIRDFIEIVRPADVWPGFLLTVLATLIGAVVGAFVAWLFARNLAQAERNTREKDREQERRDRAEERAQEKKDREVERSQAKADRSEEIARERADRQAERDELQRQSEEEFNARREAEYEDRMDIQFEQIVRVSHRFERLMAKAGIPDQDLIVGLADEYYGAVESAIVYARDEDRTVLIAVGSTHNCLNSPVSRTRHASGSSWRWWAPGDAERRTLVKRSLGCTATPISLRLAGGRSRTAKRSLRTRRGLPARSAGASLTRKSSELKRVNLGFQHGRTPAERPLIVRAR